MSSNRIQSLYKSRFFILELLKAEKYDTNDYEGFSINEVEAMFKNNQLDILVVKNKEKTNEKKIYIKYYLGKTLRNSLNDIIEDLFTTENGQPLLKKETDTLVIITDDDPNETIIKNIRYKFDNEGIFIVIFNIKRLQYNVRTHSLQPIVRILEHNEVEELKKRLKINSLSQLPEIGRFDPLAMAIFMRPKQVYHCLRNSQTAVEEESYRVCV